MTNEELRRYMIENPDFAAYVERFCRAMQVTVEKALKLKAIEDVALYYRGRLKVGETERS